VHTEHSNVSAVRPRNTEQGASFSPPVDLTKMHSMLVLVFVLAGALLIAVRRGVRPPVALARVLGWLAPASQGALPHSQRSVRDFFRPLQPGNLWRQLTFVPSRQGLTLFHFSAQLEPCLTHVTTLHTLNTPSHPLNTGYTTPTRTPYPIQSAQVELKSGRV